MGWRDELLNGLQAASNSVAGNLSGPVDILNAGLGLLGVPVSPEPFAGSAWMAQRGLTRPVRPGASQVVGETVGLLGPALTAAYAPQIARGLLAAGDATPRASAGARMPTNQRGSVGVPAPRDDALETARVNGVKMLGLPENNAPLDRARAMGFDVDAWHGTNREITGKSFDMSMLGENTGAASAKSALFAAGDSATPNAYMFADPDAALGYLKSKTPKEFGDQIRQMERRIYELQRKQSGGVLIRSGGKLTGAEAAELASLRQQLSAELGANEIATKSMTWTRDAEGVGEAIDAGKKAGWIPVSSVENPTPNVLPLKIRTDGFAVKDYSGLPYRDQTYAQIISENSGKPGVVMKATKDGGPVTDIYAIMDPSRVRSRFAAFDPARINESDLLGRADPRLLAAIAAGGGGLYMTGLLDGK